MRHYDPEVAVKLLADVKPEEYARILRAVLARAYNAGYGAASYLKPFMEEQVRLASSSRLDESQRERLGNLSRLIDVPLKEHFAASSCLSKAEDQVERELGYRTDSASTLLLREEELLWVAAGGRSENDYEHALQYRCSPERPRDEVMEENARLRGFIRDLQIRVNKIDLKSEEP